jgi:hypothetical protein
MKDRGCASFIYWWIYSIHQYGSTVVHFLLAWLADSLNVNPDVCDCCSGSGCRIGSCASAKAENGYQSTLGFQRLQILSLVLFQLLELDWLLSFSSVSSLWNVNSCT